MEGIGNSNADGATPSLYGSRQVSFSAETVDQGSKHDASSKHYSAAATRDGSPGPRRHQPIAATASSGLFRAGSGYLSRQSSAFSVASGVSDSLSATRSVGSFMSASREFIPKKKSGSTSLQQVLQDVDAETDLIRRQSEMSLHNQRSFMSSAAGSLARSSTGSLFHGEAGEDGEVEEQVRAYTFEEDEDEDEDVGVGVDEDSRAILNRYEQSSLTPASSTINIDHPYSPNTNIHRSAAGDLSSSADAPESVDSEDETFWRDNFERYQSTEGISTGQRKALPMLRRGSFFEDEPRNGSALSRAHTIATADKIAARDGIIAALLDDKAGSTGAPTVAVHRVSAGYGDVEDEDDTYSDADGSSASGVIQPSAYSDALQRQRSIDEYERQVQAFKTNVILPSATASGSNITISSTTASPRSSRRRLGPNEPHPSQRSHPSPLRSLRRSQLSSRSSTSTAQRGVEATSEPSSAGVGSSSDPNDADSPLSDQMGIEWDKDKLLEGIDGLLTRASSLSSRNAMALAIASAQSRTLANEVMNEQKRTLHKAKSFNGNL